MFNSLYAKLAAALLVLLTIIGALYLGLTLWSTRLYLQDANQQLHRGLARSLVSEGLIGAGGEVSEARLQEIFHTFMVVNPSIEVYLAGPDGELLAWSAPPGAVRLEWIDLAPVREFLAGARGGAILGDDPRHPERRTVFSAAPVRVDDTVRGYLYVVLAGEPYTDAFALLRASYVTRLALGVFAGALAAVFLAGLFYFAVLTRPLRRLCSAVERFQRAGDGHLPESAAPGDELAQLAAAFAAMAERIRDQMATLQAVDRERREWIGNLSHDLRTPLASLEAHLETLQADAGLDAATRRQYFEVTLASARRLGQRIEQLLELAHLDDPRRELTPEPFDLGDLVQDVLQKFGPELAARSLGTRLLSPERLPRALGDVALVERAVENLLRNALQHSPRGAEIEVAVAATDAGRLELRVRDQGPGIPSAELPRVFERFYSGSGGEVGHGLGLAIVRRIAELHGGEVAALSPPTGGSVFRLLLPGADIAPPGTPPIPA